jgi:hypothetical protein
VRCGSGWIEGREETVLWCEKEELGGDPVTNLEDAARDVLIMDAGKGDAGVVDVGRMIEGASDISIVAFISTVESLTDTLANGLCYIVSLPPSSKNAC